jgi:MFS family permease
LGLIHAPASLLGGKMADSFGRKRVLVIFESLAALGYGVCIFLQPSLTMVHVLMISSFCFGMAGPSHDAITADLTEPHQRDGAYSLNYLGFNLGFAFAQVIAGLLFRNHLKYMFLIDAATALAAVGMIGLFVKETLNRDAPTLTEAPAESSALPFPSAAPELAPLDAASSGSTSGGAAAAEAPALEAKTAESIFAVLKARPLLLVFALAAFGYRFVYSQWSFLIPLHAEFNFPGEGARLFGMLGSTNALFVVFFTPLFTALLHKRSNIRRIFYAGILFTLGFGMLGYISFKAAFFISVIVFTSGEILEAVSTMPFIMNHTPASHRGRMSSVLPLLMGAGFSIGPLVSGAVLDATSFRVTWTLAAAVVLVSTLAMKGIDIWEQRKAAREG